MEICELYGIRHSEFLAWDPDDRDKALAYRARQRDACPNCGTRAAEWDERVGGHRHAYVPVKHRCRGCELVEGMRSSTTSEDGKGVYIALRAREVSRAES